MHGNMNLKGDLCSWSYRVRGGKNNGYSRGLP